MTSDECQAVLRSLYDAMLALAKGERAVSIMFSERQVTYSQGQLRDLQALYQAHYRQCGADSGLPDLSAAGRVARGAPATYRMF